MEYTKKEYHTILFRIIIWPKKLAILLYTTLYCFGKMCFPKLKSKDKKLV